LFSKDINVSVKDCSRRQFVIYQKSNQQKIKQSTRETAHRQLIINITVFLGIFQVNMMTVIMSVALACKYCIKGFMFHYL